MAKTLSYIFLLGIILAVVSMLSGFVVIQRNSTAEVTSVYLASGLAAGVVWLAGSIGLLITLQSRGHLAGVSAMLLAMLVRIVVPLVVALVIARPGSNLAEASFFGLLVVHYLVALVIETMLNVHWLSQQGNGGSPDRRGSLSV